MAGALDWLMNLVQGPHAQVTGDGVTYGPAVSRITRTPIDFTSALPIAGQYQPDAGKMLVNPANADDVGGIVRHESVHALMSRPGVLAAATGGPAMASAVAGMPGFIGQPSVEAPAYISQNQPGQQVPGSNITQQWSNTERNAALAEMLKNVQHKDASAGSMLQRLSVPPSAETLAAMRTQ